MRRDHIIIACLFFAVYCLASGGCGSGAANIGTPPAGCSQDVNRPNYCGDVGLYTFEAPVITYRIVEPGGATDIRLNPITAAFVTPGQADSIRDGFAKWETAMTGARQIVEVPATDTSAMIDVVVQAPSDFTRAISLEPLGKTEAFISDVDRRIYGRCVVRILSVLPARDFRRTALHEIGHSLGIDGHSRHFGDVMYPLGTVFDGTVDLSEYDRNTIRANYAQSP